MICFIIQYHESLTFVRPFRTLWTWKRYMVEPWKDFDIAYHLVVHVWNCSGIGRLYIKAFEISHSTLFPSKVIYGAREISCDVYEFHQVGIWSGRYSCRSRIMVVTASYGTEVWLEQFPNLTCWYAFDATGIWSIISGVEKVSVKHVGSGFLALSYLNTIGDEKHCIAPALKHQLLLCLNPLLFQQLFILPILGSSWIDSL